jgi:hypothetical protein
MGRKAQGKARGGPKAQGKEQGTWTGRLVFPASLKGHLGPSPTPSQCWPGTSRPSPRSDSASRFHTSFFPREIFFRVVDQFARKAPFYLILSPFLCTTRIPRRNTDASVFFTIRRLNRHVSFLVQLRSLLVLDFLLLDPQPPHLSHYTMSPTAGGPQRESNLARLLGSGMRPQTATDEQQRLVVGAQ